MYDPLSSLADSFALFTLVKSFVSRGPRSERTDREESLHALQCAEARRGDATVALSTALSLGFIDHVLHFSLVCELLGAACRG